MSLSIFNVEKNSIREPKQFDHLTALPKFYVQIHKYEDTIYNGELEIIIIKTLNKDKVNPLLLDAIALHFDYGCPVCDIQEGMWLIECDLIDDSGWTDIGYEYSDYVEFTRVFRLQSIDPILDQRLL